MKKVFLATFFVLSVAGSILYALRGGLFNDGETIYLNAGDNGAYQELLRLKEGLQKEGKRVVLSPKGHFKSGNFNLYAASDDTELPKVLDTNAINFLWITRLSDMWGLEKLQDFDVIVVKSYPLFNHLKAVNVRTAYIPQIIEVDKANTAQSTGRKMYFGDAKGFSLALYLAGKHDLSVDIFGKGFEGKWPKEELKGEEKDADFNRYALVLTDQSEEDIGDEIVNPNIIKIIEGGGVPFVRYNLGVKRLFSNGVVMYGNEEDFLNKFTSSLADVQRQRNNLYDISKQYNSQSAAQKFIELFEIMQKKRI